MQVLEPGLDVWAGDKAVCVLSLFRVVEIIAVGKMPGESVVCKVWPETEA